VPTYGGAARRAGAWPRLRPILASYQGVGVTTQAKDFTADKLLHLPDDGFRYELVRGELKKMAPAGSEHGNIAMDFGTLLNVHVRANKLGKVYAAETGFKLSTNPDTVRVPDVVFISQRRLDEVGPVQGYWPGAPDLAVEVVSPSDLYTEVSEKVAEWLQAGSEMVVVVNPRTQQVLVHLSPTVVKVLGVGDTLGGGEVVPG
jgi:Uma2 family endonuclease